MHTADGRSVGSGGKGRPAGPDHPSRWRFALGTAPELAACGWVSSGHDVVKSLTVGDMLGPPRCCRRDGGGGPGVAGKGAERSAQGGRRGEETSGSPETTAGEVSSRRTRLPFEFPGAGHPAFPSSELPEACEPPQEGALPPPRVSTGGRPIRTGKAAF